MGERGGYDGIGGNGHGSNGDDPLFRELDALSDEDLELLAGRAEDEDELRALAELAGEAPEAPDVEPEDAPETGRPRSRRGEEEREVVGLRLFPDWEYEPLAELVEGFEDAGVALTPALQIGNGDGARTGIARVRQQLRPAAAALKAEGFYAYGTLDDQNRWTVAVDDELGRVDVRLGPDGLVLDLRATSPGLYADVDHPFRRRRLERAARENLPRIDRGLLEPHQSTAWDEVDEGVAVGLCYLVPLSRASEIGRIVRQRLPELEDLLALVEQRVAG